MSKEIKPKRRDFLFTATYTVGAVAAPLFAKIAESSLNHLGYFEDE